MTPGAESPPEPPDTVPAPAEAEAGVDLARLLELAGLALRAPRRRPLLVTGVLLLGCLATAAAALWTPRVYTVSTKILVQDSSTPLLGARHQALPAEAEAGAKAVTELILRRDNLVAIVDENHLAARWDVRRPPALKLLDRLRGPVSEQDRARGLVGMLGKKIDVQADETTITISLGWYDPEAAHQIVASLGRAFLESRSAAETSSVKETIAILEGESARQRETIAVALTDARNLVKTTTRARAVAARPRGGIIAAPRGPSEGDGDIAGELARKRRAVQDMEDAWQRRHTDLKARLDDLRLTYAPAHPSVIALEDQIQKSRAEPPELKELKQAEGALLDQVKRVSGADSDAAADAELSSPDLAPAKARLRGAVQRYEDLKSRLDSARLELESARAVFKYRYVVIQPPELPTAPTTPNVLAIVAGGLAITIVLAIGAACARDLTSDRFVEPWQAKRLPIPLLAEVAKP